MDPAGPGLEVVHDPATERAAPRSEHRRVQRQIPRLVGPDPAAEVPAEQHRTDAVDGTGRGGQLADGRPVGDLGHARMIDRAADGHERAATRRARAELAIPAVAVTGDERDLRERLDVLDQGRAPADPALEWSWWDRSSAGHRPRFR